MLTFLDHWERYCDLRLADEFPFNQQGYVPDVQVEVNLKNIKILGCYIVAIRIIYKLFLRFLPAHPLKILMNQDHLSRFVLPLL